MCGICGAVTWNGAPPSSPFLSQMNDAMVHRGPDDHGSFSERFRAPTLAAEGEVSLAMRRLAIIDVACGKQPMESEDGSVVVVYNGEIYNFAELRSELESHGHAFRTRSDTEVLVHGYEVWGDAVVQRLNGMFA